MLIHPLDKLLSKMHLKMILYSLDEIA